jgi:hypothetical protein
LPSRVESFLRLVGGGRPSVAFGIVTAAALLLFVPNLSLRYDPNGLYEATGVMQGGPALCSPNHLLYRPAGAFICWLLRGAGDRWQVLLTLQALTSVCAAAGVGFSYLAFLSLTGRRPASIVASAWLATSCSYWSFSVDAYYITPAAMFVAAALWVVHRPRLSLWGGVLAGLLAALAVLTWQGALFLVPALAGLVWTAGVRQQGRHALVPVAGFAGAAASAIGLAYLGAGLYVLKGHHLSGLVQWFTNYGGGRLPQWGHWGLHRLPLAANTALRSVVPINGLGDTPRLVRDFLDPDKRHAALLVLALSILLGSALVGLLIRLRARGARATALWLAAGYCAMFLFSVWWDPWETKWFVVANVMLAALVAMGLAATSHPGRTALVAGACVVGIAVAVFRERVQPLHAEESRPLDLASCLSTQTKATDLLVATDWSWEGYVRYFFGRRVVSVLALGGNASGSRARVLGELVQTIRDAQAEGAAVYMVDVRRYQPAYLRWLAEQTGVTAADLATLEGTPAFTCGDKAFLRLKPVALEILQVKRGALSEPAPPRRPED